MRRDHFDLIAGWYDRSGPYTLSGKLEDWLALEPGQRLLDAAGGTGRFAEAVRGRVRQAVVADLSRGMLQYARAKAPCACAQVEALPFASASFDRIFMLDAFHHVIDQARTARELWRALAPGGILVIQEPDIHQLGIKFLALFEKLLLMRSHFRSGEQIAGLFADLSTQVSVGYDGTDVLVQIRK